MIKDAPKKAKQAGMPIADIELVMMSSAAVLAAQHFPHEVNNWEGLPAMSCMWPAGLSALPTSSASTNSKLQGVANPSAVPTR
jgi:hypothetical protein